LPSIRLSLLASMLLMFTSALAQTEEVPKNISDSVAHTMGFVQKQFVSVAEAMPEAKYSYVPTSGNFEGARTFGEQVKHVACAQFAFFNQMENKTPPEHCEKGGPSKAQTKTELLKYLRDSFDYGNRVLATINAENAMQRVNGPYAGPNSRLGMSITAVWHITDHYGQMVEYLRMNGIVPPVTVKYGLKVR
jgi:hypothetical protein